MPAFRHYFLARARDVGLSETLLPATGCIVKHAEQLRQLALALAEPAVVVEELTKETLAVREVCARRKHVQVPHLVDLAGRRDRALRILGHELQEAQVASEREFTARVVPGSGLAVGAASSFEQVGRDGDGHLALRCEEGRHYTHIGSRVITEPVDSAPTPPSAFLLSKTRDLHVALREAVESSVMGSDISLFSGYAQKENRTTNYCLLVLKMLYEENPKFLGEVLSNLVDEDLADVVGVQFRQQTRKKGSVPDGLILQRPFTIYIETKHFDWFYNDQLERHLAELNGEVSGSKSLIALGNFEALSTGRFRKIETLCEEKYQGSIYFAAVSFEEFLDAFPTEKLSKNFVDILADFEGYLDEEGLLPRWKNRLDVVNCSGHPSEITKENVYICPAKGGAYKHSRARFFGMYRRKAVNYIAVIEAVIDLASQADAKIRWKNVDVPDAELISRAAEKRVRLRPSAEVLRVFLLGPLHETDFKKPTRGGMQSSKRYFDVEKLAPSDAADLATKLRGKSWANY